VHKSFWFLVSGFWFAGCRGCNQKLETRNQKRLTY
jgi:hypothetical protein